MIIFKDIPFEKQAQFMRETMCAYPDNAEFQAFIETLPGEAKLGLQALHTLLKDLYADTKAVNGKDDQARYLSMLATVEFLYAVCAWGQVTGSDILIDKATLKQHYKKGSLSTRQKHLARYGVQVGFISPEGDAVSMSQASHLALRYPACPDMLPAAQAFTSRAVDLDYGKLQPLCNSFGVFLRADFQTALLGTPNVRDDLDPLRDDLVGIFDAHRQDWLDLAGRLNRIEGMQCTGFWTYGGVPAWSVSFAHKGKRPLAIFTLASDVVFIEFTLPLEAAEQIILDRHSYSDKIRNGIENFRCVNCPKQCKGANLKKVDGVWLCSGRAEARRIYTYLETPQDFASIHAMLDVIYL